ncbi:phage major capsid protein [Roseicyclus mahoneyensis]|uniref:HK97 family phage major capsid protein n=1 Tax=Roseicyclus mahoneyensis TaxID=164332 RepID=A0A316GLV5_9RHOB|nr:phage major capsid protein [Roseicyclus mahoneyensis]PWK62157.1 HK97 family phage major capsid protein [Roseicyclus mahoneyensis]
MTETRTGAAEQPRAAQAPLVEVKEALGGFLNEFSQFQNDLNTRFQKQEERIAMLTTKTMIHARPALSAEIDQTAPHKKALATYLRNGDDDGLRGLEIEHKGLSTAVNAEGGYLVDPQTAETIQSVLRSASSLRAVANVVRVEASSFDVLIDTTDTGAGWADEVTDTTETTAPQIERISIPLFELSAMPKASQRLLDDSAFDIEGWLAGRIADKFARAEAAAFINGDGAGKPTGILNGLKLPNTIWAWGALGYVVTGTAGDFDAINPADAIVDLVYALGAQYRAGASFVMNSKTAGAVRKMKDADGRFLWSDGLAAGEPARLMGYPVLIAEDMPDIDVDATAIAFGDFGAGYTIAERPDLRVLRDPFSAKPHVLFYATKRVGGAISDFAAIKLMKFGLS